MSKKCDNIEINPQQLERLNERLDLLFTLQNKYHVESNEALIALLEQLRKEAETYSDEKEQLTELEKTVRQAESEAQELSWQLSESRKQAIPALTNAMVERLCQLGMKEAVFSVDLAQQEELRDNGADIITFLFSANSGVEPADMSKIASGGEMSRIMLCLKSIITDSVLLPTIIFDEIDTGISGETASKVGHLMQSLSGKHQVIAITHLPQIAACGNQHYLVYKQTTEQQTSTHIRQLDMPERELMIATMISGESHSESAVTTAREMLHATKIIQNQ